MEFFYQFVDGDGYKIHIFENANQPSMIIVQAVIIDKRAAGSGLLSIHIGSLLAQFGSILNSGAPNYFQKNVQY